MNLSDGEKLILWMLSDLHKHLDLKTSIDPELVQSAILSGNTWALESQYGKGQLIGGEISADIVEEVTDILDMWSFIEAAYSRLSPAEKAKLKIEAEPFGEDHAFSGFDGNHDHEHRRVASFLIEDLERFQSFKGREHLNSHSQATLPSYRRMYQAFKPIRVTLADRKMGVDDLIKVLKGRHHPKAAA